MQVIFCVAKLRQTVCDPLREIGNLVAGLVWFGFTNNNPKRILKQRFVQGEIQHLVVSWKMKAAYKFHLIAKHKHFWPNSFHLGPETCCFVRSTRKIATRSAHQNPVIIVKVQDPTSWYVLVIVELKSWNYITAFVNKNAGKKIWIISQLLKLEKATLTKRSCWRIWDDIKVCTWYSVWQSGIRK